MPSCISSIHGYSPTPVAGNWSLCVVCSPTQATLIGAASASFALPRREMIASGTIALGNGILTVDTDAQAWSRARPDEADKGGDAARAALSLVRLARRLAAGRP